MLQNAKGTRLLLVRESTVDLLQLINQRLHRTLRFPIAASAAAISPSGQWIAFVSGLLLTRYFLGTQTQTQTTLPDYTDVLTVNDNGDCALTAQRFIDGTVYKVTGSNVTTQKLDPLFGRKFLWLNGSNLRIADATRYGTPGSLVAAPALVLGYFDGWAVLENGKVIGPTATYDFAAPISEAYDCGKYVVVRLADKYSAVKKADATKQDIPQSDIHPVKQPRRIAVAAGLKTHTGIQLALVQGDGKLTLSGPVAFLKKFFFVTINDKKFPIDGSTGSVDITTAILTTEVKQLFLSDSEFNGSTAALLTATTLNPVRYPLTLSQYLARADNPLMGTQDLGAKRNVVTAPTEYQYGSTSAIMSARTLETKRSALSVSEYIEQV
jgi:hypothetical protein